MYFLPLKGEDLILDRKKIAQTVLEGKPGTEEVLGYLTGLGMSGDLLVHVVAVAAHELGVEQGYSEAEGRRLSP